MQLYPPYLNSIVPYLVTGAMYFIANQPYSFIFANFATWSLVRNKNLQVYRLGTISSMPQTCSEHMPLPKQARNKGVHYSPDKCNQYKNCQFPIIQTTELHIAKNSFYFLNNIKTYQKLLGVYLTVTITTIFFASSIR